MKRPSKKQLAILVEMAGPRQAIVSRDDTDTPARWYFDGKRLNRETAKVLYCRGWIEIHARTGLIAIYKLSESGRAAYAEAIYRESTDGLKASVGVAARTGRA